SPARLAASAVGPRRAGSSASLMDPAVTTTGGDLEAAFGRIDIYLFDQLLRGRFDRRVRVLDAGCGDGRNLVYLLGRGFECFAVDRDPSAITRVRQLAAEHAPALTPDHFRASELDALPWPDASM